MKKMKLFKKLFKKKEEIIPEVKEIIEETPTGLICEMCKESIFGEQKIKTFAGKKYHLKPCFRNLMKQGKLQMKGY